ncbi:MAG: 16S rRNA (cytosine(1402)-N(4))-methyltransferase RsmH [Ignavibacteria bacterium CG_4_8_14_3_um_filter_37_9]|nr:16S rRNA (cytosine(1402)-N(4))-methyltransferase RsmH [Ignavibacteria bacterium]OIO22392.1 MAG: 16S rRNA (cytosine(1402)-N(4))-methyltransferase [Ignavibacteria bacterium CG1_02_37_35]PIP77431.1 MAG: SAM-dependent methyltransferase [Ignavibacteria bacterium CG22_combo_CG10-13_8_21_14_all_37_15]PIS45315.1 MAG: 16S rRNA (cytosine(1402)-N(4))-methyltransferase RsmH [Ignavibacteria bacterium CG08_land_8_20_14_0_20_37_9]PIW99384.1 MAG: 16S rRNA (cytosine(1402)-N(4))-methyltransferase RsmH [Ignavi
MTEQLHQPVLLNESVSLLISNKSGKYFDGTLGFGGHSEAFLQHLNDDALLAATDVDETAFSYCQKEFVNEERMKIYNFNFTQIDSVAKLEMIDGFDGIFADLGVSSYQLDNVEKGFTFRSEAPLDLRMNKNLAISAADVLNTFEEEELTEIFYKYGEEKNSRKIAKSIIEQRGFKKFQTSSDLVEIIEQLTPQYFVVKTLARIFQALRIYVNDELTALKTFLSKAVDLLLPGGRIVILTYHSLEDRIVKDFFKFEESSCICPPDFPVCTCSKVSRLKFLMKKPILPTEDEILLNNRARSAKLRAAEKK